jgi:sugar-phosphatase
MTAVQSLRCRAILFDLDGVLVDSSECVERTWREWATRHDLDPERVISMAHGRRAIETVQLVAPKLSADAELTALANSEATTSEGIYEIAGARELLAQLPAGSWAIVTSGIRAVAEFRLRYTGLPVPPVMVCADEITRGKPDPEGYLLAAARLGRSPAECIVIEDTHAGIDAAHAGGMRALAIATTYPRANLTSADAVAFRLTDVTVVHNADEIQINIPGPA